MLSKSSYIYKLINKILNCLLMIDEAICKFHAKYLISRKFITCTFCWMQCTNRFFYIRKYQCVKQRNNDFIDATKSFFSWCNRIDFSNNHRNCFWKIVCTRYFSENLLRWCFIECNVHNNFRICKNINALIVVAIILLSWSNCSFHCIIDLMLQKFNVYINAKRLH